MRLLLHELLDACLPVARQPLKLVTLHIKFIILLSEEAEAKIPVVRIIIDGGPDTIHSAYEAVQKGIPLIVVAESGRAANIMASVFKEK